MPIVYDLIFLVFALSYLPAYVFKRKFHQGFLMRLGFLSRSIKKELDSSGSGPIWVHAVSVGEVKALSKLIDELHKEYPGIKIVISTVTPTGNKVARALAGRNDVVLYLPFDISFIVRRVIKTVGPAIFIIAETEIWPNLIWFLHKCGIPVVTVNARISDSSFRGYSMIKPFLRPVLSKVDLFCVQTKTDAGRLMQLGVEEGKISVTGNMKFDIHDSGGKVFSETPSVAENGKAPAGIKAELGLGCDEKLWVAGSTHPGEEEIILDAYNKLITEYPPLRLLIAPRHPERSRQVGRVVMKSGYKPCFVSECGQDGCPEAGKPVFILDSIGKLTRFYSMADIIFVGGSLVKKGGQNILEPAFLSKPVICGPHMFNFRDIVNLLVSGKAVIQIKTENELSGQVKFLLENPLEAAGLGKRARDLFLQNKGATARNIAKIKSLHFEDRLDINPHATAFKSFFLGLAKDRGKGMVACLMRPPLYVLSLFYNLSVRLVSSCYIYGIVPSYRSAARVISVGNITLGGTGKTPLVELLARYLNSRGIKLAVLSRGYGRDEPMMLEKMLPWAKVLTGRDRIKNAKKAEKYFNPGAILLDDGFQHWRIKRDLDIVAINATDSFGNRQLIPRGILREPLSSLSRADIIMLTRVDIAENISLTLEELKRISPSALIVESAYEFKGIYDENGRTEDLGKLKGQRICLLSGIADPSSFKKMVLGLGIKFAASMVYPDHYNYRKEDICEIRESVRKKGISALLTTEKDFVRLPWVDFNGMVKVYVLGARLRIIRNEKEFFNRISCVFTG